METSADRTARPGPTHPPSATPPHDDAHTGGVPRVVTGRRRTALLVLAGVAVLSAAALVVGLATWAPERAEQPRALTVDERERLAAMRVTNYRDLRAGVRVTAGAGGARTELVGWVDWSRPMVYLDVGGPGAGAERGLLQATPTVACSARPDGRADPRAAPAGAADGPLAAARPARRAVAGRRARPGLPPRHRPPGPARRRGAPHRWGHRRGPAPVDILQAPPPGPGASAPPPSPDGQPRYWLDQDARLHRLETGSPGAGPVTVQLNRADRPTLRPVDALGGRPGSPGP